MKNKLSIFGKIGLLIILSFCFIGIGYGQTKQYRFNGKHYGDHPNWNYFAEVKIAGNADVITYEKKSFDKDKIKKNESPSQFLKIQLKVLPNKVFILNEELFFEGGSVYSLTATADSVTVQSDDRKIVLPAPREPLFFSVEGIELYLSTLPLNKNFQQDIRVGLADDEKTFRPFRIKVVGELTLLNSRRQPKNCYEVAIYSLDESNVGDSKLYIDKENLEVIKKEYLVVEKTQPNAGLKSQAIEYAVNLDYAIDLKNIKSPNQEDYIEAAFTNLNNGKTVNEAVALIDKALELGISANLIISKISVLNHLNKKEEAVKFAVEAVKSPNLSIFDIHRIGRDFLNQGNLDAAMQIFQFNAEKNPSSSVPLIGLARVLSAKGDLNKAKEYLQKSLLLEKNENQINWIKQNLERLEKGVKIL